MGSPAPRASVTLYMRLEKEVASIGYRPRTGRDTGQDREYLKHIFLQESLERTKS